MGTLVSSNELLLSPEIIFEKKEKLGQGSYGSVFKGDRTIMKLIIQMYFIHSFISLLIFNL